MCRRPKKGKFQDFHDFRASGGPERPPTAPTGSGVTAWVLRTSGNRFTAGNRAHIEVKGELTTNQQEQLRTIGKLIQGILEEK